METGGGPTGATPTGAELVAGAGWDVAGLPAVQAETRTATITAAAAPSREYLLSIATTMDS
jgi:hypothetical protein